MGLQSLLLLSNFENPTLNIMVHNSGAAGCQRANMEIHLEQKRFISAEDLHTDAGIFEKHLLTDVS